MTDRLHPSFTRRGLGLVVLSSASLSALSACSLVSPTTSAHDSSQQPAPTTSPSRSSTPAPPDAVISKAFASDPRLALKGMSSGTLGAPHLSFRVQTAISQELPSLWVWQVAGEGGPTARPRPAASGQEWLLVLLRPWAPMSLTKEHRGVGRIVAGKADIDLTELVGTHHDNVGFAGKVIALALSVPKGAKAALTVTDEKRTATFDLRTGRLADDAASQLMALAASSVTTKATAPTATTSATWSDGTNSGGITVETEFVPDECFLTPWHPQVGWAKAGRGWLVLAHRTRADYDNWPVQVSIDPTRQVTLTVGKQVAKARGQVIDLWKNITQTNPQQVLFDVPQQVTGGTLTLTLPPSFVITYKEGIKRTLALKAKGPLTTAITIKR
ncbi:hypothetical protein ACSDQ9_07840 [Aestuariimicrobium soli]|uniref:hypothetical protein n=1 Tax=Aestuariimicrobium soli TaxID=2035834 RepID=UPI003EBFEE91